VAGEGSGVVERRAGLAGAQNCSCILVLARSLEAPKCEEKPVGTLSRWNQQA
jgi:hypothetical protein